MRSDNMRTPRIVSFSADDVATELLQTVLRRLLDRAAHPREKKLGLQTAPRHRAPLPHSSLNLMSCFCQINDLFLPMALRRGVAWFALPSHDALHGFCTLSRIQRRNRRARPCQPPRRHALVLRHDDPRRLRADD
eukprot:3222563-Rhodomonas_salina.2